MSRKPRQTAAFSLFTFLDVMLCTLGALIIVLICVVRTAQIKNADEAPESVAAAEEIESQRDTVQWRTKHLETSREQTRAQLQDRRLELSHIEEHSRRLRQQLEELEAAHKALAGDTQHQEQLDQLRAEARRVSELAAAAERELEEARRTAQSRRPSYAVVPYEGPNQTMRRPMYIECTAERIVMQPEGIELTPQDLQGPLGPSNPLAAGLRAAREFLNDSPTDYGEPYPLLLVRPDGIEAYYHAREAMSSWGAEFGYEFIDQDWKLEFREPPPGMVDAMRVAVDEARMRQRALARAAPSYYGERRAPRYYRAAPGGGVVQDSGPTDRDEDDARGAWGGRRGSGGRGTSGGGHGGYAQGSGRYGQGAPAGAGRYRGQGGGGYGSGSGNAAHGTNTADGDDLASLYGPAANAPPGALAGRGAGGTQSTGANGTGSADANAPIAGGLGAGPGGGTNMLASGNGTGQGGSSFGTGTGTDSGNSFLAGNGGAQAGGPALGQGYGGNEAALASANRAGGGGGGFSGNAGGTGSTTPLEGPGSQIGTGGANNSTGNPGGAGDSFSSPGVATQTATGGSAESLAASGTGRGQPGGTGGTGGEGAEGDGSGAAYSGAATRTGETGAGARGGAAGGKQARGGMAGQAGGQQGSGAASGGGSPGGQAGMISAGSSGGGQMGAMSGGTPTVQFGGQQTATGSMADSRGKNWSLPEEARHAVPISRPVRIECTADKLVLPTDQSSPKREIAMSYHTEDAVEPLVGAVWQRVETWGSAGRGMYWRPELSVDVAPGAEGRFADLKTLLADSGIEVKAAPKAPPQIARPKKKLGLW